MEFTRDTTIDPSSIGDTVLQAIVDLDHDLSSAFSGLNEVIRGSAFRLAASERGADSGVCELDSSIKVPTARLPEATSAILPAGTVAPVGTIGLWAAETAPMGWAECEGTKLSQTTYADLFSVIEYAFGGSKDEGEFSLPDLRGVFVRGMDHGAGVDPDAYYRTDRGDGYRGDVPGSKQATENLAHAHNILASTGSANYGAAQYWPSASTPISHPILGSGGNEGRPINVSLMWIIRTS